MPVEISFQLDVFISTYQTQIFKNFDVVRVFDDIENVDRIIYGGGLFLSREMAVNEALPCDRNRFLVGISKSKKFGRFHVFFSFLTRNLLFSRNSFWLLENELLIENPTKKHFQIPTKKQISHVNWEKYMEAPEFFQVRNPD